MSDVCPALDSAAVAPLDREGARRALDAAAVESGAIVTESEAALFVAVLPLLDPGDAGDARRALRHAWSSRPPGPRFDGFFARLATEAPLSEARHVAALLCGQNAMFAGDLREAERRVRTVLLACRGSGSRVERTVVLALARISLQLRQEFEALVLARHAVRAMDVAGDAWGSVSARLTVCAVFSLIGDLPRLAAVLDEVEPRIDAITDPVRRVFAKRTCHGRRAEVLQFHERYDAALGALRAGEYVGGDLYPEERRSSLILEADILFARGDFERAADHLTAAARLGSTTDMRGLRIRARRLCLNVCRGVSTTVEDADALLDDLEVRTASDIGPAARREYAILIGDAVASVPAGLPVARRAFDVAAAAAFERLIELDRFVREVPESATPTVDDLIVLEQFRRRSVVAQREVHVAVARLIARAVREGRTAAPMLPTDGELTCVCAWCQRVRTTDGVWLSIQQFLPLQLEGAIELTHGICDSCFPALRGQLYVDAHAGAA